MKNTIILVALVLPMQAVSQVVQTMEMPADMISAEVPAGMNESVELLNKINLNKLEHTIKKYQRNLCEAVSEGEVKLRFHFDSKGNYTLTKETEGADIEVSFKCKFGKLVAEKPKNNN